MDCPRCQLPLKTTEYEGVETDMCESCWGFWLDSGELEDVLARRELTFSEEERKLLLDASAAVRKGPTDPAPCPKCGRTMKRLHYDASVQLILDQCPDHGIWLDTGEIKKVQALAEQSQEIHRMLLAKLGLTKSG